MALHLGLEYDSHYLIYALGEGVKLLRYQQCRVVDCALSLFLPFFLAALSYGLSL